MGKVEDEKKNEDDDEELLQEQDKDETPEVLVGQFYSLGDYDDDDGDNDDDDENLKSLLDNSPRLERRKPPRWSPASSLRPL